MMGVATKVRQATLTHKGNVMNVVKIPVTRCIQHGRELLLGRYDREIAKHINIQIDTLDPDTLKGYQRISKPERAKEISEYVSSMGRLMPTSILINFRQPMKIDWKDENIGYLLVESGTTAWVYDGQNRQAGISRAWDSGLENYAQPAVYSHFEMKEELYQFNIINKTAKGVDGTLVQQSIKNWLETFPPDDFLIAKSHLPRSMRGNIAYLSQGFTLASRLNRNGDVNQPWKGLFAKPNENKCKWRMDEGKFQGHFLKLIKNKEDIFPKTLENKINLMINYGKAWKELCPNSFTNQKDYLLLRSTGIEFMAGILYSVCRYIDDRGIRGIPNSDQFKDVLEKLDNKSNDNFWKTDNYEGAKRYHGGGNIVLLINQVEKILYPNE